MTDLTVFAEGLISTVARAFYEDEVVCLIDVLIRDKFLRDDDMQQRLQLPVKKLRATLTFLQSEHIVKEEHVDDLHEGGSQATKFFYIDYCTAVHSIRLRLHLLRQKLEKAELQARSSSFYLCPGYKQQRCNGRYTEEEAQRVLNMESGLFLCQECSRTFENDPNAPPLSAYTLQLVDNETDLKLAMDNLRRLNVQLSAKYIGNHQLRPGIYDWLQKVRGGGGAKSGGASSSSLHHHNTVAVAPITSNLPSENFALGIGSTRLAGTGRTAGIKAQKMQQKGLAESSAEARQYLVGGSKLANGGVAGGGSNNNNTTELMFLKSAHGHEIQFTVEKGGGARAQVLAGAHRGGQGQQRGGRSHRRRKLLDTAASRVGVTLPLPVRVALMAHRKRKRQAEAEQEEQAKRKNNNNQVKTAGTSAIPDFLIDNIGRGSLSNSLGKRNGGGGGDDEDDDDAVANGNDNDGPAAGGGGGELQLMLDDEWTELAQTSEEARLAAFQAKYKQEMERQERLLRLASSTTAPPTNNELPQDDDATMDSAQILWEDGFA
ncbi:hypothetical protein ACA910_009681 [Epithemia clementina (nom. ined.)]